MKLKGNDYRLFVGNADGSQFAQPAGQGNLTRNGGRNFTSNATKDTEGYDTQTPGLRTLTLTLQLTPSLPDENGYTRMEALNISDEEAIYQIRKKPFAEDDVVFAASMYTTLDDTAYNQGESVTVGTTLTLAATPTVDKLS